MRKLFVVLSALIVASMLLSACGAPAATPAAPVIQTVVVAGTPEVQVVVATPVPETKPASRIVAMSFCEPRSW